MLFIYDYFLFQFLGFPEKTFAYVNIESPDTNIKRCKWYGIAYCSFISVHMELLVLASFDNLQTATVTLHRYLFIKQHQMERRRFKDWTG